MTTNVSAPSSTSPQPANYAFLPPDPAPRPVAAASPPPTRFRFKTKPSKRDHDAIDNEDPCAPTDQSHKRGRRSPSSHSNHDRDNDHYRRHRRRRRRGRHHDRTSDLNSPPAHHDKANNNEQAHPDPTAHLDADAAFRASLFDALADDEGAAFWEGVYGQPIHTYANVRGAAREEAGYDPGRPADEGGDTEEAREDVQRMTEDEYVAYVRARMWEKTHEAVMEERERRRRAAERQAKEKRRREKEQAEWKEGMQGHAAWTREVEDGLRRGERRKEERRARERWGAYVEAWDVLGKKAVQRQSGGILEEKDEEKIGLPWPVGSGQVADVSRKGEVEGFLTRGASIDEGVKGDLRALLKQERVRWHPDKMRQRFGPLDDETLQAVTAVFQIVGRLWEGMSDNKTQTSAMA